MALGLNQITTRDEISLVGWGGPFGAILTEAFLFECDSWFCGRESLQPLWF